MPAKLHTAPDIMPVTLDTVKQHLRIESDWLEEDDHIDMLIAAATARAETLLNRKLITQTWELMLAAWPADTIIELPWGRLQSVTSVMWVDESQVEHTVADTDYGVDTVSILGRIAPAPDKSWPTDALWPINPITVRYVCGYGDAVADVPADIQHAIKVMVSDSYEYRETGVIGTMAAKIKTTMAAENLLRPYRIWSLPV